MDKYVMSDIKESERIKQLLDTGEYDTPAFLPTDGDIPFPSTLFSIFHLAPRYGIEIVVDNTTRGTKGFQSAVICKRPSLGRSAAGGAQSKHKDCASFMAWAKSIRALMLTEELIKEHQISLK